jgi:hypothetical protein
VAQGSLDHAVQMLQEVPFFSTLRPQDLLPLAAAVVVDALQGGAGTSANMNVNEVLANRAEELLGGTRGTYALVSPLAHANLHQSTNDVFPTAVKVAAIGLLRRGFALGLLVDQPPAPGAASEPVSFLGRPALATRLVPVLARRTGAAVVAALARRTGTCQHRLQVVRLEDPSRWLDPSTALRTVAAPRGAAILGAPGAWSGGRGPGRGAPPPPK